MNYKDWVKSYKCGKSVAEHSLVKDNICNMVDLEKRKFVGQ